MAVLALSHIDRVEAFSTSSATFFDIKLFRFHFSLPYLPLTHLTVSCSILRSFPRILINQTYQQSQLKIAPPHHRSRRVRVLRHAEMSLQPT